MEQDEYGPVSLFPSAPLPSWSPLAAIFQNEVRQAGRQGGSQAGRQRGRQTDTRQGGRHGGGQGGTEGECHVAPAAHPHRRTRGGSRILMLSCCYLHDDR